MISDPMDPTGAAERAVPEWELVQQAQAGNATALNRLIAPYTDFLFRLAYRVTEHTQDAEDLAQEALLRVLRGLPAYQGECAFRTWVYRVALNVFLTARSRPRLRTETLETMEVSGCDPDPQAVLERSDLERRIGEEVFRLPSPLREALWLRWADELSYSEIAETLDIPLNTALTRVHRGMKRLRQRLGTHLDEETRR
jgi:RNA polymerase sigma-70 factor (ECF subfamily)